MIKTKRIYDPPAPADGYRLLVMRRWPRGITKRSVDGWEPDLGPSLALLTDYRKGKLDWPTFAQRYEQEMSAKPGLLAQVADRAKRACPERSEGGDVSLLCACQDEERCHRTLLKRLLEPACR